MYPKTVSLIGTNIAFNSSLPVNITENIELRRATIAEIKSFDTDYDRVRNFFPHLNPPHRVEFHEEKKRYKHLLAAPSHTQK